MAIFNNKAEESYKKGYAFYLKYGKDLIDGKKQDPQDLENAIIYFQDSVANDSNLAKSLVMLGLCLKIKGNKSDALTYLKRALDFPAQLGADYDSIKQMVASFE